MKTEVKLFRATWLLVLALTLGGCLQRSAGAALPGDPVPTVVEVASPATPLSATLVGPGTVEDGTTVPVTFTLANNTDQTLYVLTWFTPLEGIANEIFTVSHEGTPVPYEGILAKRGGPLPEDYVQLTGGATASATVDLAEAYDFSQAGDYSIAFLSPRISHVASSEAEMATTVDELGEVEIPCDPLTVTVLPSESGEIAEPPAETAAVAADSTVTLEAKVGSASPSARIISLETSVAGITTIALLEDTEILTSAGQRLTLNDLQPGLQIAVTGQPGDSEALLATEIRVLDTIEPTPSAPPPPDPAMALADPGTPGDMQRVVDESSGVSLLVPADWTVIAPQPGNNLTIVQSYPKDTYVGSGGVMPPDTKCDLTVHPEGSRAADLIGRTRAEPQTTVLSEEEITLWSGRSGTRMDLNSLGPARILFTQVENRAVVFICFGDLEPFDAIAATIGSQTDTE